MSLSNAANATTHTHTNTECITGILNKNVAEWKLLQQLQNDIFFRKQFQRSEHRYCFTSLTRVARLLFIFHFHDCYNIILCMEWNWYKWFTFCRSVWLLLLPVTSLPSSSSVSGRVYVCVCNLGAWWTKTTIEEATSSPSCCVTIKYDRMRRKIANDEFEQ